MESGKQKGGTAMTRDDLRRFCALNIDFDSICLMEPGMDQKPYFCTPVGAEHVGRLLVDGIHFILLPGDERVFCVDPSMGEPGTYVLPVASDFRTFLSYILFCKSTNPIAQIAWLTEERFRRLLADDEEMEWPGSEEFFARQKAALAIIADEFELAPADPYQTVKDLQKEFDPGVLAFSDEYYDVLGIER